MSRLDPPGVLLERTFIDALLDDDDARHPAASACYASLLDDYEAQRVLLKVLAADRRDIAADPDVAARGAELLAPATTLRVSGQHRRTAARMDVDADIALLLVVLDRYRLARIASFDPRLAAQPVDVIPRSTA